MKSPGKANKRNDAFFGCLAAFFRPAARAVRRLWVAVLCRMGKAVDIGSNGEWPGAMLSNFAPHSFTFRGIRFACMEGLLQGLKFAGEEKQAKIFGMEGKQAKRKGKKRKWWLDQTLYWQGHPMGRSSAEYASLVREAFDALSENSGFREALLATGDKRLYHTMGKTDPAKTVLTEGEFCAFLSELRSRMRQNTGLSNENCLTKNEAIGTDINHKTRKHDMNTDEILRALAAMKESRRTPETIDSLKDGEIFVFGTDPAGEHRSRAARLAVEKFGAKPGLAYGPSGRSFALPVHRFKPAPMVEAVRNFLEYARANPQSEFLVLPIGCGAAGMDPAFVALMFREAVGISNIRLCGLFIDELENHFREEAERMYGMPLGDGKRWQPRPGTPPPETKDDLLVGRNWIFARTADGRLRFVCGKADGDFILAACSWRNVVRAAAGFDDLFAVLESGKIRWASNRAAGHLAWCGVESLAACEGRVAALLQDGAVLSSTDRSGYEKPEDYDEELRELGMRCKVKRLAVSWLHAAVLDSSGNVTVVGAKDYCKAGNVADWHDVVDVDVFGCYYSPIQTVGLRRDGRVLHTIDLPEIDGWRDIVSVSCGGGFVAGLDTQGRIHLAADRNDVPQQTAVAHWPPMRAMRAGFFSLAAVDEHGTIWVV